jgi:hypothetical protein
LHTGIRSVRGDGDAGEEDIQMKSVSIPMKIAGAVVGLALVLGVAVTFRTRNLKNRGEMTQGGVPSCTGTSSDASGPTPSNTSPHPHSVTLSWNAAVPVTNSPRDAIKGYYVYRSVTSQSYSESNRISQSPVRGTRCIDIAVEPRTTYFYVVKALSEGGAQSAYSTEIRAAVPFP